MWFGNAADVDMDEMVIVTATQPDHAIGTCGLGPCIAICARGLDHQVQPVLAMHHYSGVAETPEQALAGMAQAMRDEGN